MVWTTVDIDLNDIDNEVLITHLVNHGYVVRDKAEADREALSKQQLQAIHTALHLGKQEEAFYLMTNYVADLTGRVI